MKKYYDTNNILKYEINNNIGIHYNNKIKIFEGEFNEDFSYKNGTYYKLIDKKDLNNYLIMCDEFDYSYNDIIN